MPPPARVVFAGPLTQAAGPFSAPKTHMQIFSSHEPYARARSHLPKSPTRPDARSVSYVRCGFAFYKKICYDIKKRLLPGARTKHRSGTSAKSKALAQAKRISKCPVCYALAPSKVNQRHFLRWLDFHKKFL